MTTYGEMPRQRRMELNLSLREFTSKVGGSLGFWSEVEGGHRPPPELDVVNTVEEVLEIADHSFLLQAAKERRESPLSIYQQIRERPNLRAAVSDLAEWSEDEVEKERAAGLFNRRRGK